MADIDYSKYGVKDIKENPSMANNLLSNISQSSPVQFTLGAGDALRNMMGSAASALPGVNIHPVQTGEGSSYQLGKLGGEIGGFFGGGEILDAPRALLSASKAAPELLSALASKLGGAGAIGVGRRATGSAIGGALSGQENRGENATRGAELSLATELIPGAAKTIGKVAEQIIPKQFTKDLLGNLKNEYKSIKDWASTHYNPVMQRFKNYKIERSNPSKNYSNIDQDVIDRYFTSNAKKLHYDYMNDKTFENAHNLQSQLATEIRALQGPGIDYATQNAIQEMGKARNAIKTDMLSFLKQRNPYMAHLYQKGSDITRDYTSFFKAHPELHAYVEGSKTHIDPNKAKKILNDIEENNKFSRGEQVMPSDHPILKANDELNSRMNRAAILESLSGIMGGALTGAGLTRSPFGTVGGGMIGKMLARPTAELIQNPQIESLAKILEKIYAPSAKAYVGGNLQGS